MTIQSSSRSFQSRPRFRGRDRPLCGESLHEALVGFCQQRGDGLVEQVEAAAQVNVGSQNGRPLAPRAGTLPRPPQCPARGVFPEVDAVPQPVPVIRARPPLADRLLPDQQPPGEAFGAAVVADDNSSERVHTLTPAGSELDRDSESIPGNSADRRSPRNPPLPRGFRETYGQARWVWTVEPWKAVVPACSTASVHLAILCSMPLLPSPLAFCVTPCGSRC